LGQRSLAQRCNKTKEHYSYPASNLQVTGGNSLIATKVLMHEPDWCARHRRNTEMKQKLNASIASIKGLFMGAPDHFNLESFTPFSSETGAT